MDEEDDFIYIVMIVRVVQDGNSVGWRDFFFLKIVVAKMRK